MAALAVVVLAAVVAGAIGRGFGVRADEQRAADFGARGRPRDA